MLQGDGGYSRKSLREQASYYYSQPHYTAKGSIIIDDKPVDVTGQAWLDREWSSQPLASDQSGWDWLSLHFKSGDKLMLYRMRQTDGQHYGSGKWIAPDGKAELLASADIAMTPLAFTEIEGRKIPTSWRIAIPKLALAIDCTPLNAKSWMGTSFPYWEGPISFAGSHAGVGLSGNDGLLGPPGLEISKTTPCKVESTSSSSLRTQGPIRRVLSMK